MAMSVRGRLAAALLTVGAITVTAWGAAGPAGAVPVPAAAAEARAHPAAAPHYPPFTAPATTLRLGAKGAAVRALQARLKELGYHPGKIDGRYGGAPPGPGLGLRQGRRVKPGTPG